MFIKLAQKSTLMNTNSNKQHKKSKYSNNLNIPCALLHCVNLTSEIRVDVIWTIIDYRAHRWHGVHYNDIFQLQIKLRSVAKNCSDVLALFCIFWPWIKIRINGARTSCTSHHPVQFYRDLFLSIQTQPMLKISFKKREGGGGWGITKVQIISPE